MHAGPASFRPLAGICLLFVAAASASAQTSGTALVRRAPSIQGTVEGSVHQLLAEQTVFNGGAIVTGDLLVPGTPTIRLNGSPNYGGTLDAAGAAAPTNYQVVLNGAATLRHVVRRTNPIALPAVSAPPPPAGTRSVTIGSAGQGAGDWATLRDLTLSGGVGLYTVPPGGYGEFTANGGSGFTLGVAGASEPAVYHFQRLALNGRCEVRVAGPVVVTVANGFNASGTMGAAGNPGWFTLNVASGSFALNAGATIYGYIVAPNSAVTLNGSSQLTGGVAAERLAVNGNALLRLIPASASTNQPPGVVLTAPANGSTFVAPASFTLRASAADADGIVTKVEFFRGTAKLGEGTAPPYEFPVTGLTAGTYEFVARATDNFGATADSAAVTVIVTTPNQPPAVALTSPADGALYTAPATIPLAADAADPDGSIARVEFLQGLVKLGEDTSPPYEFSAAALPAGTYTFTARAYDNQNAVTTSPAVTATVVDPNQPPIVALTSPANGASYPAPATFTLVANAADSDGTIARVEFYQGATKLGEDTSAPFEFLVSGLAGGTYNFVARAYDDKNSATDSLPITITVTAPNLPPSVTLTLPTDGAVLPSFTNVVLSATATDPDGAIARVEFFQGSTRLGDGSPTTASTYSYTITPGLAPGAYSFFARAHDDAGATADSSAAAVSVLAGLPYTADFEATEGYALGSLAGQLGWQVPVGSAIVVDDAYFSGARSVTLTPGTPPARIAQTFAPLSGESIIFIDFFAKPVAETEAGAGTMFDIEAARFVFVRNGAAGELRALDGDGAGGGTWQPARFATPVNPDGVSTSWIRVTLRLDFAMKRWDLFAGGMLVAADLKFRDNTRTFLSSLAVRGHLTLASRVDYLFAGAINPLFVDHDKDGMDDAWEVANGLDPTVNDRDADKDGDGLSNIVEYMLGTRADLVDTDGDGLSDSLEIAIGTNPLVSDALKDTDGDGVSDAAELLNGTDPKDYYNGVAPNLTYTGLSTLISRKGLVGPWPVAVSITNAATGASLPNAPVTFDAVAANGRFLASETDATGPAELLVRADSSGVARAWLKLTAGIAAPIAIHARVHIGLAVVRELAFQIAPAVESPELALGTDHSMWLDDAGVVRAWGRNTLGQLGDGTFAGRGQMGRLSSVSEPLKAIASGHAHGLATNAMGQVYVWGDDYFGQLGDNRTTNRRVPALLGNLSGIVQLAAGDSHSLALSADGSVWAWGGNQSGQLGDGTTTNRLLPVQLDGLANIVRVVAGARHSAALAADGIVWTWGSNDFGQLGAGGISERALPAAVSGLSNIVTIASGRRHLLALRSDGSVLAWGDNHAGQLGIGIDRGQIIPQLLTTLPVSVGVAAGANHSVALAADGVLRAWGANDAGQLGTGATAGSLVPTAVNVTSVRAFAAGGDHVVVLKTDGSLQAWGLNTYGQLGAPAGPLSPNPIPVSPPVD